MLVHFASISARFGLYCKILSEHKPCFAVMHAFGSHAEGHEFCPRKPLSLERWNTDLRLRVNSYPRDRFRKVNNLDRSLAFQGIGRVSPPLGLLLVLEFSLGRKF